jgi:hypothetical protein
MSPFEDSSLQRNLRNLEMENGLLVVRDKKESPKVGLILKTKVSLISE